MPLYKPIVEQRHRTGGPLIILSLKPVSLIAQRSFCFFHENGSEFSLVVSYDARQVSSTIAALQKFDAGVIFDTEDKKECIHKFRILYPQLHAVKDILIEGNPTDRENIKTLFAQCLDEITPPLLANLILQ